MQNDNDKKVFDDPVKQTLFEREEEVLKFWKESKIFEKSLDKNPKSKLFSFYDGPPFITGKPHYGNLLSSIAKDVVPRYQTMKGRYVPRVWGWDVHGLPIENEVEQALGLKNKKDVEALGIGKFIEEARKYVNVSTEEWRWYIDHIGRWADMDHPYRTDQIGYIESVIWVFKQLFDKGLVYKGRKVFLYCTRCATVVSKFETTMEAGNYRDVEDPAVTIAFKLKDEENTYVLAWTTTPWTLPANNGLAAGPDVKYVKISDGGRSYILAEGALARYPEFDSWERKENFSGKDLAGKSYEPLLTPNITPDPNKDYKIYLGAFATTEEGTGIVHIAPAFGEDDFTLGQENNLTVPMILDDDGKFLENSPWSWAGKFYKSANADIVSALKEKNLLVREDKIRHSYPHCYRCGTPLIYMAQDSWLINIDSIRKHLQKTNKKINWVPAHFGDKRFAYNIETAPDWSISRTRYWGIPIPIWETDDGELIVPESIEEIEKLSGQKVTDLHRPDIDEIVLKTPSGKEARRVKEVLDVWFESGSMPYAQDHYPFENKEKFENGFPTDFIVEHVGQLRGWFYSLHVISTILKNKPTFKNAVVTGTLAGTDGRKMSKSFGNFPDPRETIEKYGAEALRLYLMSNKIMMGEDASFSEDELKEAYATLNILHNSHKYFVTYANLHGWTPSGSTSENPLDMWITARTEQFVRNYSEALDKFDLVNSSREIRPFIEDLSTWYIRRSRDRFAAGDKDALETLHMVLVKFAKAAAPLLPFSADSIYKDLCPPSGGGLESVHLEDYPEVDKKLIRKNENLIERMSLVRDIASIAHSLRSEAGHALRQKLATLVVKNTKNLDDELVEILRDEVNVSEVRFDLPAPSAARQAGGSADSFACGKLGDIEICLDTNLTDELRKEGIYREIMRALQDARKKAGLEVGEKVQLSYKVEDVMVATVLKEKLEEIKEAANFSSIDLSSDDLPIEILNGKIKIKIG